MITIFFNVYHFFIRGTEASVYDYAHYNETILNNKSIIVAPKSFRHRKDHRGSIVFNEEIYQRFKNRFTILEYIDQEHLNQLVKDHNCSIFFNSKSGDRNDLILSNVKNVNHCVFYYEKQYRHGDIYIPISPCLIKDEKYRSITPHLPYIVTIEKGSFNYPIPDKSPKLNFRQIYNIPENSIIFGRHGGEETFDIKFVYSVINKVINRPNNNIYFFFVNTLPFTKPNKFIIHHPTITNAYDKYTWIQECDAMLHARVEGETFGLAVAEFSIFKKKVFTHKEINKDSEIKTEFNHHHLALEDEATYFHDEESLYNSIINFQKPTFIDRRLDKYSEKYSPKNVMKIFLDEVVNREYSLYNHLCYYNFESKLYFAYETDGLAFSLKTYGWEPHVHSILTKLLNKGDIFVDIGSNLGYHTARLVDHIGSEGKIFSFEPNYEMFTLLKANAAYSNIELFQLFISDKQGEMYAKQIKADHWNYGIPYFSENPLSYSYKIDKNTLDNIIQKKIHVIKIDTHGHELNVIKGALKLILEHKPYIILPLEEQVFKNNNYTTEKLVNLFKVLGYNYIEITSDYICDFLFFPIEKEDYINTLFRKRIQYHEGKKRILENENYSVKMTCNWESEDMLYSHWKKMENPNLILSVNQSLDKETDYYVIINRPNNANYDPKKTIVFRMEPDTSTALRWNDWYKNKSDFMYFLDLDKYRNNSEWHLGKNYSELMNTDFSKMKTKVFSTVMSSLYFMEGHVKRIEFLKYMHTKLEIDVYGHDNKFNFRNYKGSLPYQQKDDGIIPYKYTFIAENCDLKNYFTEKILDPILGETLCFYWGCHNLENFIDSRAFIRLELKDFESDFFKIRKAIENNEWEKRLEFIKKEKIKILYHYSFFPRVEGFIMISTLPSYVISLDRRPDRFQSFQKEADRVNFNRYEKFSAIDGSKLEITDQLKNMFRINKFNNKLPRLGEIGCSLSHLSLWTRVTENILIMEDDVTFCDNFNDRLAMIYRYIKKEKILFDFIYLGYHLNDNNINEKNLNKKDLIIDKENKLLISVEEISKYETKKDPYGYHGGGAFGYIISPLGAKKMLKIINKFGFVLSLDYQMLLNDKVIKDNIKSYCTIEPLIFSNPSWISNDSDIQYSSIIYP